MPSTAFRAPMLALASLISIATFAAAAPPATTAAPAATSTAASTAPAPSLADTIGLDANVRTGVLANGLRYYIRVNHKPEKRAALRLAVNAGSTVEQDDQDRKSVV